MGTNLIRTRWPAVFFFLIIFFAINFFCSSLGRASVDIHVTFQGPTSFAVIDLRGADYFSWVMTMGSRTTSHQPVVTRSQRQEPTDPIVNVGAPAPSDSSSVPAVASLSWRCRGQGIPVVPVVSPREARGRQSGSEATSIVPTTADVSVVEAPSTRPRYADSCRIVIQNVPYVVGPLSLTFFPQASVRLYNLMRVESRQPSCAHISAENCPAILKKEVHLGVSTDRRSGPGRLNLVCSVRGEVIPGTQLLRPGTSPYQCILSASGFSIDDRTCRPGVVCHHNDVDFVDSRQQQLTPTPTTQGIFLTQENAESNHQNDPLRYISEESISTNQETPAAPTTAAPAAVAPATSSSSSVSPQAQEAGTNGEDDVGAIDLGPGD